MFKIHLTFIRLSLFCGLAFALPSNVQSQTFLSPQEVLRGLEAVGVVIEGVKEDERRDGLSDQRLRTVTELTLRSAGISVQSEEYLFAKLMEDMTYRQAFLYVSISAMKLDDGSGYAFHVWVRLDEMLRLLDDSGLAYGAVWRAGSVGRIGSNSMPNFVVEAVRNLVEQFANDYLAANPRNQ